MPSLTTKVLKCCMTNRACTHLLLNAIALTRAAGTIEQAQGVQITVHLHCNSLSLFTWKHPNVNIMSPSYRGKSIVVSDTTSERGPMTAGKCIRLKK
jgi:hypothetical protein